jgi:hypothetical protein
LPQALSAGDDERFLCDVFTDAEIRPLLGQRPEIAFEPDEADAEGYTGLCEWTGEAFSAMWGVQVPGRAFYDEVREDLEQEGAPVEPAEGFDGEAVRLADEMTVLYAVFDGTSSWLLVFFDIQGIGDADVTHVRGLTAALIERQG